MMETQGLGVSSSFTATLLLPKIQMFCRLNCRLIFFFIYSIIYNSVINIHNFIKSFTVLLSISSCGSVTHFFLVPVFVFALWFRLGFPVLIPAINKKLGQYNDSLNISEVWFTGFKKNERTIMSLFNQSGEKKLKTALTCQL